MGPVRKMSVLETLQNLSEKKLSQLELNYFIEYCLGISLGYMNKKKGKLKLLCRNGRADLEDLAVSAIVPLFCRDSEDDLLNLRNIFRNWEPVITSEAGALYMLHRIIELRVSQQITATLKAADPVFTRVLYSVNYHARKMGLEKIKRHGTVYIVRKLSFYLNRPYIGYDDFLLMPGELFGNEEELFEEVFGYLEERGFYPAIPVNLLVRRIKSLYQEGYAGEISSGLFHDIDVDYLIKKGLEAAGKRISVYELKGKLTSIEASRFNSALKMAAFDIKNGGLCSPLMGYLKFYMEELTDEQYHTKYQNSFEYFIKILRNTIAGMLLKSEEVTIRRESKKTSTPLSGHLQTYSSGYSISAMSV